VIRLAGERELRRTAPALFLSGLAAGLSMGFSLVTQAILHAALPRAPWSTVVSSFGYAAGFVLVIMGRQQLFTENTLTPVLPLLHSPSVRQLRRLLRLWGIVLLANVVGASLFALAAAHTANLSDTVRAACLEISAEALEGSSGTHFLRAILSGWLIAMLVWILAVAERSRLTLIVGLTYLVGIAGLSHDVAGTVEGVYAVSAGTAHLDEFVLRYFLPTLAGNVLGGTWLGAALSHAQVRADRAPRSPSVRAPGQHGLGPRTTRPERPV
jgi:formate-nitrite transporter family protein